MCAFCFWSERIVVVVAGCCLLTGSAANATPSPIRSTSSCVQSGYLDVVVSPDILNGPDTNSAAAAAVLEEGLINEGGQTQLVCSATGVPEPTVQWRRENGKDIVLRSSDGRDKQCRFFFIVWPTTNERNACTKFTHTHTHRRLFNLKCKNVRGHRMCVSVS